MDHETDGDGAINLSTSQRPSAATTPNGNIEYDDQDQVSTVCSWFSQPSLDSLAVLNTTLVLLSRVSSEYRTQRNLMLGLKMPISRPCAL